MHEHLTTSTLRRHGSRWLWGKQCRRALLASGLPWRVVTQIDDYGTSPGDVVWTGATLLIEETCPEPWIFHEIAHFLVCKTATPEKVGSRNWGFADFDSHAYDMYESQASAVNVEIMRRLHLPWVQTALELNMVSDVHNCRSVRHRIPDAVRATRLYCGSIAAPYASAVDGLIAGCRGLTGPDITTYTESRNA